MTAADPAPGRLLEVTGFRKYSICRTERPALEAVAPGHFVSCHRARALSLRGIGG